MPGRRGFTFLEVLFAVIILGIGFIMLAGMFPVAIQQQQASVEESQAPVVATSALAKITNIFANAMSTGAPDPFPITGNSATGVQPKFQPRTGVSTGSKDYGAMWIAGNQIVPSDPAWAWVLFYARDTDSTSIIKGSTTASILIVPVHNRSAQAYSTLDATTAGVLTPTQVTFSVTPAALGDTIAFTTSALAIGPGAWVVVSDDPTNKGATNGEVFQLGALVSPNTYQLIPGKDFSSYPPRYYLTAGPPPVQMKVTTITNAKGYVIGNGNVGGLAKETGVAPVSANITLPAPP